MCSQIQLNTLQQDINEIIREFEEQIKPKQVTSIKVFEKRPKL